MSKRKQTNQPNGQIPKKYYAYTVIVEPDEDVWRAYCPVLEEKGGATWGMTKEESFRHIQEVVQMVVESLLEHGEKIPEDLASMGGLSVTISAENCGSRNF